METPARKGQELRLLPTSTWGRSAVGLAAAFVPLTGLFIVLLVTGPRGGTTLDFTPQMLPGILAAGSAIGAVVTGLVAVIARHDRSLLTFAALGIGAMVSFFLVGEFAIPPYD